MIRAAESALREVLKAQPRQSLLIIADTQKQPIGEAFFTAAENLLLRPQQYVLPDKQRPFREIPEDLKPLLPRAELAVTLITSNPEETPFRIELIKNVLKYARRLGHGPGITEEMMTRGPMNVDYSQMARTAEQLMAAFMNAVAVDVHAPGGTNLRLGIEKRGWETDVEIPEGRFGNLPCGEVWCAPVEVEANGIMVCDGSIGDFGKTPAPLKLELKDGKIVHWECTERTFGERVFEALSIDTDASVVGELGIGVNPGARITGNLLEDEKALKTIHIAFGNNQSMPGGKNRSRTHRDFLVCNPTLTILYRNGDKRVVLKEGNLLL